MHELNLQESIAGSAHQTADQVLTLLSSDRSGLTSAEAARRLAALGLNAVRTHKASGWSVLGRQLRSPILVLLLLTAGLSLVLGDTTNSIVIGVILLASIGLGFTNEFRAERAAEALHTRVTHRAVALRDGDIVELGLGAVIPADLRLLTVEDLLCDESIPDRRVAAGAHGPRSRAGGCFAG